MTDRSQATPPAGPRSAAEDEIAGLDRAAGQEDFAGEHSKPTFADELAGRPGMEPDEATQENLDGS